MLWLKEWYILLHTYSCNELFPKKVPKLMKTPSMEGGVWQYSDVSIGHVILSLQTMGFQKWNTSNNLYWAQLDHCYSLIIVKFTCQVFYNLYLTCLDNLPCQFDTTLNFSSFEYLHTCMFTYLKYLLSATCYKF